MFKTFKDNLGEIEELYNNKNYTAVILESAKLTELALKIFFDAFHSHLDEKKDLIEYVKFERESGEKFFNFLNKPTIGIAIGYYNRLLELFPNQPGLNADVRQVLNTINSIRNNYLHLSTKVATSEDAGMILDAVEKFLSKTNLLNVSSIITSIPLKYFLVYKSIKEKFDFANTPSDFKKIVEDSLKIIPPLLKIFLNAIYHELTFKEKEDLLDLFVSNMDLQNGDELTYYIKLLEGISVKNLIDNEISFKDSLLVIRNNAHDEYSRRLARHYVNVLVTIMSYLENTDTKLFFEFANDVKKKYLVNHKLSKRDRIILNEKVKDYKIAEDLACLIEDRVITTIEKDLILFKTLTSESDIYDDIRPEESQQLPSVSEEISSEEHTTRIHRKQKLRKWVIRGMVILAALLTPVVWFVWPFLFEPRIVNREFESSVAVMLFEDVSDVRGFENFASGATNDLISRLSRIQNLKVATITESLRFRQRKSPIRAICKDLGVQMVLQGSIKVEGENITLTAELVDGEKDIAVWQQSKVGRLENILVIQDEIVGEVVQAINVKYASSQIQKKVGRRPTKDFKSYELFLKGDAELTKWTHENLIKSLTFYNQAIQLDQNFIDAYAHSALANLSIAYLFVHDKNVIESIKKDAKKALKLEGDNEIALMSMEGYYMMKLSSGQKLGIFEYRDFITKLKSLVSKNPTSHMALFGLAEYFRIFKRDISTASDYFRMALTQCERILQSDSTNGIVLGIAAQSAGVLGQIEYRTGHYKEAIEYTEYSIQLMPGIARTYSQLASFYFNTNQSQKVREVMDRAISNVTFSGDLGQIELFQGKYSFVEGRYHEAERYWADAMTHLDNPSEAIYDYAFLYRYVTLHKIGNSSLADTILRQRIKVSVNLWPEPVILFFAGDIEEENILKLAIKNWQKCELFYFLGEKCLMSGDLIGARKQFEECLNTKVTDYLEYDMAEAELNRLLKEMELQ